MSFKEFLQDYEESEKEKISNFIHQLEEGNFSQDDFYPPKERFVNLRDPIAVPATTEINIWGLIPFNGSTIVSLIPRENEKKFNGDVRDSGFSSRHIDRMIDFVKETGRLQFGLLSDPTDFINLEFLEPLFYELEPPALVHSTGLLVQGEMFKNYMTEFDTLSQFGFSKKIKATASAVGSYSKEVLIKNYAIDYISLKTLGYDELADEIGTLMIVDTKKAMEYFQVCNLIVSPITDPLRPIYNFNRNLLTEAYELGNEHGIRTKENIPYEVGGLLLEKTVLYPETLDGCMEVIQKYDDSELSKVRNALYEGVIRENVDVISDNKVNISEILDNVWANANEIKTGSTLINFGVTMDLALIGMLATGYPGLLAGLGFLTADKFWGFTSDSLSEKITKLVSPNHLVTMYEFKEKHMLKD